MGLLRLRRWLAVALDSYSKVRANPRYSGGAQRRLANSNPRFVNGPRRSVNPKVHGSSPLPGAKFDYGLSQGGAFLVPMRGVRVTGSPALARASSYIRAADWYGMSYVGESIPGSAPSNTH